MFNELENIDEFSCMCVNLMAIDHLLTSNNHIDATLSTTPSGPHQLPAGLSTGYVRSVQRPDPDGPVFGARCIGVVGGREPEGVHWAVMPLVHLKLPTGHEVVLVDPPAGREGVISAPD